MMSDPASASDELIEEMVAAALVAIAPITDEAYDKATAELDVLQRLLTTADGTAIPDDRVRGLQMLQRLMRPVLIDVAVEIVRAIDTNTLPLNHECVGQRMGLDPW